MANSGIELPLIKSFVIMQSTSINFIEVIFSETPLIKAISLVSLSFLYIITILNNNAWLGGFVPRWYFSAEKGWWNFSVLHVCTFYNTL